MAEACIEGETRGRRQKKLGAVDLTVASTQHALMPQWQGPFNFKPLARPPTSPRSSSLGCRTASSASSCCIQSLLASQAAQSRQQGMLDSTRGGGSALRVGCGRQQTCALHAPGRLWPVEWHTTCARPSCSPSWTSSQSSMALQRRSDARAGDPGSSCRDHTQPRTRRPSACGRARRGASRHREAVK